MCLMLNYIFFVLFWIFLCSNKAFGCTSTKTQYKRPGDDVTIQFKAWTVHSADSSLLINNQILSNENDSLLTAQYQNGVKKYLSSCNKCTFNGNADTGDLSIKLDNLQKSDAGTYKLSVSQTIREVKECIVVYILGQPQKPSITLNKVPFEGESVILTCSSTSTTTPSDSNLRMIYNWKVDNNNIPSDITYTYSDTKHTLTISNINRNDANKNFTCTAKEDVSNSYTSTSSDQLRLDVYYKPDTGPWIQSSRKLFGNNTLFRAMGTGQQTLDCSVTGGYPSPSLSWVCFTGTEQDLSSGQTITKRWTWTSSRNGTCKCTSTQMGAASEVVLYVRILLPPTSPEFQLNSQAVQPSSTVKIIRDSTKPITCSSTSYPPSEYKWTYNGQSTEVSQEATLNPSQVTRNGHYYCNVQNTMTPSLGSPESGNRSAYIDIEILSPPSKPELRYHDQSNSVITGSFKVVRRDNFNLYCSSTGNPTPNYQWTGDGRTISKQVIVVSSVQQDRSYTCKATNTMNPTNLDSVTQTSTSTVSVSVLSPATSPTIEYHYGTGSSPVTSKLKVIKGKSFSVSCSSTGIPTPTLMWSEQMTQSTNTLTITSIQSNATYVCTASNDMNRTFGTKETVNSTSDLQIEVLYGPYVTPFNVEPIVEGTTLSVECKADPGNPARMIYSWNRKLTSSSTNYWQNIADSNISGGQLVKQNINRNDTGTYNCTASNVMKPTAENQQKGSSSRTFLLDVLYPASILSFLVKGHMGKPSVILDENDEEIQILCEVDSNPPATIRILFNGKIIKTVSATTNASVLVRSVSCLDSGEYTCEGSNDIGQPSQRNMQLFVKCSPRPQHRINQNISSLPTMQVILSFTALAYPNPGAKGFSWHKENGNDWTQVLANKDLLISSTALQSNLTIQNVTKTDYGRYRLTIKNDLGTYVQYFGLTEKIVDTGLPKMKALCNRSENNDNTIITGITLGIVNAILVGYGAFITILYKRRSRNKESGIRQHKSTQKTYMNISYNENAAENQQGKIERNAACSDDENKQYTDLSEYSRDDKTAYDILSTQLL